jgi:hypothetical protein
MDNLLSKSSWTGNHPRAQGVAILSLKTALQLGASTEHALLDQLDQFPNFHGLQKFVLVLSEFETYNPALS